MVDANEETVVTAVNPDDSRDETLVLEDTNTTTKDLDEQLSATERAREDYEAMLADPGLERRDVVIETKEHFTDAQLAEKGVELVGVLDEIDAENDEFASEREAHKARIKQLEEGRDRLRKEIDSGEGMVKVNAIEFFIPKLRKVIAKNPFDGTIVKERSMTTEEIEERMQLGLLPMTDAEIEENAKAFLATPDADLEERAEQAYNAGAAARHEGDTRDSNPHDAGSYLGRSWNNGFDEYDGEVEMKADEPAGEFDETVDSSLESARESLRSGEAEVPET